ncbi:hypothetical protein GN956_G18461, partial [Arapaima gigas]
QVRANNSEQLEQQPGDADPEQQLRGPDGARLRQMLESAQDHGEAERGEEHRLDQRAQDLRSDPSERVLLRWLDFVRKAKPQQRREGGQDVGQHLDGVGEHSQGVGEPADQQLQQEEAGGGAERA